MRSAFANLAVADLPLASPRITQGWNIISTDCRSIMASTAQCRAGPQDGRLVFIAPISESELFQVQIHSLTCTFFDLEHVGWANWRRQNFNGALSFLLLTGVHPWLLFYHLWQ